MPSQVENWQRGGFGLYLHWPFCQAKCPYCDFNSYVSQSINEQDWRDTYFTEIDRYAAETEGRVLTSIFFGGGTPSLMSPTLVSDIIAKIRDSWTCANDIEITLEANPSSVEAERFEGYAKAGVNRVSMGVQSFDDDHLRQLGRLHTAKEAREAITIAKQQFSRFSFDLIYARQNQSLAHWEAELSEALALQPSHLSLYQLTIENGTAFGDRHARGKLHGLPDDELAADMYFLTQKMTGTAGLDAYEISNHAKPGEESLHNLIYWRGGDYLGIGPGAHGRITSDLGRIATETELSPTAWIEKVQTSGSGETVREVLTTDEITSETIMMSLRLREGIARERLLGLSLIHISEPTRPY